MDRGLAQRQFPESFPAVENKPARNIVKLQCADQRGWQTGCSFPLSSTFRLANEVTDEPTAAEASLLADARVWTHCPSESATSLRRGLTANDITSGVDRVSASRRLAKARADALDAQRFPRRRDGDRIRGGV